MLLRRFVHGFNFTPSKLKVQNALSFSKKQTNTHLSLSLLFLTFFTSRCFSLVILFCPALRRLYPGSVYSLCRTRLKRNPTSAAKPARASYAWTGSPLTDSQGQLISSSCSRATNPVRGVHDRAGDLFIARAISSRRIAEAPGSPCSSSSSSRGGESGRRRGLRARGRGGVAGEGW